MLDFAVHGSLAVYLVFCKLNQPARTAPHIEQQFFVGLSVQLETCEYDWLTIIIRFYDSLLKSLLFLLASEDRSEHKGLLKTLHSIVIKEEIIHCLRGVTYGKN